MATIYRLGHYTPDGEFTVHSAHPDTMVTASAWYWELRPLIPGITIQSKPVPDIPGGYQAVPWPWTDSDPLPPPPPPVSSRQTGVGGSRIPSRQPGTPPKENRQ